MKKESKSKLVNLMRACFNVPYPYGQEEAFPTEAAMESEYERLQAAAWDEYKAALAATKRVLYQEKKIFTNVGRAYLGRTGRGTGKGISHFTITSADIKGRREGDALCKPAREFRNYHPHEHHLWAVTCEGCLERAERLAGGVPAYDPANPYPEQKEANKV